ncbi:MAG TPA: AAA family ATPase [Xanthobacteraceae bacterium]|nr:AAA family ATPase [Xanthobacteraceae bacterium]
MRVTGLHLRAYGHFTGHSLDFGTAPGLHLIYGNNEAGKSTTLRALSSVLFGYPHDVVDGFRHDAKDIAIGIDLLASDSRRLSVVRKRRGKHALAAADGSPLDEGAIESFLGGVSRDVFEKVFALDHRRLHEHAKALLADGGSLGFSLAEAGSGIAGLKAVLDKLKAERAALFLAGGSKPKLNQAIAQLIDLRKEARRRIVSPADYRIREKCVQELDTKLREMRNRRNTIESEIVRLQRVEKNLPLRAEHQALTQRIEALEDVPILPPEFAQRRVKTQTDLDAARDDIVVTSAAVEKLERRIAAIALDETILARSEEIDRLAQRRPVIEGYETDSPKREAERAQLFAVVRDLLRKAELNGGSGNLADMLPSALRRKAIQALADAGIKLVAQLVTAQDNAEAAGRALNKARDRAVQLPKPSPVGDLSRALAAADKLGDISAEVAKRTRALERKTKALSETIIGLGLGTDRVSALRELAVPPEQAVTRYTELLAAADRQMQAVRDTCARLDAEIADADRRIAALKTAGGVATEDDLTAVRKARDQGWALVRGVYIDRHSGLEELAHRFAPDGRIADTYERHVREADRSVDVMRAHIRESTELSVRRRQKADLEAERTDAKATLDTVGAERDVILSEWRSLWPARFITVQLPTEMREWLARRASAIAQADDLEGERDAISDLVEKEREAQQALAVALAGFSSSADDDGLDALRDQARSIIHDAAEAKTLHEKAAEAVRGQLARKTDADEAAEKLRTRIDRWKVDWGAALTEAGLPPDQTIEGASATLDVINELDIVKSNIDGLTHRIEAMRHDRDAFRDAVATITETLSGVPRRPAVETCRWLKDRLDAARDAERELRSLAEQLEDKRTNRDRLNDKLHRSEAALDTLCAQAGCAGADELAEIERKSMEKQGALLARAKIETRVRESGGGRDFAALFEECDDVASDQIAGDILSLKADRENAESEIDKLLTDRAALQADFDNLLAQNQAADLMQEAAAVEAEIADAVEAYVDLTVQETLLRKAIDIYRDRNQGPILMRAKGLFAELTDGAYMGLRADINEKGEPILIAEDANRSLEIDALSDGTVDTLYVALRLAVVQEHNATHEPLPFVADDLLLNLDNNRAQAALRTLAAIAASGQVLLFTHHAHMLDLARIAVPPPLLIEHHLAPALSEKEGRRIAV